MSIYRTSKYGKSRPIGSINNIIIHAMMNQFEVDSRVFYAPEYLDYIGLSAHFYVHPYGDITASVPIDRIAWHAKGFNEYSIGIEFLVPGIHKASDTLDNFHERINSEWVSPQQLYAGARLVSFLKMIVPDCGISRHSDLDPGRKKDPGNGFPWEDFKKEAARPL